jgi:hypothetical protein
VAFGDDRRGRLSSVRHGSAISIERSPACAGERDAR